MRKTILPLAAAAVMGVGAVLTGPLTAVNAAPVAVTSPTPTPAATDTTAVIGSTAGDKFFTVPLLQDMIARQAVQSPDYTYSSSIRTVLEDPTEPRLPMVQNVGGYGSPIVDGTPTSPELVTVEEKMTDKATGTVVAWKTATYRVAADGTVTLVNSGTSGTLLDEPAGSPVVPIPTGYIDVFQTQYKALNPGDTAVYYVGVANLGPNAMTPVIDTKGCAALPTTIAPGDRVVVTCTHVVTDAEIGALKLGAVVRDTTAGTIADSTDKASASWVVTTPGSSAPPPKITNPSVVPFVADENFTPAPTPDVTPTLSETPVVTPTPEPTPEVTPSDTPNPDVTPEPSEMPSEPVVETPTPESTPTPSEPASESPMPSEEPTPSNTPTPEVTPSETPSDNPKAHVTGDPTTTPDPITEGTKEPVTNVDTPKNDATTIPTSSSTSTTHETVVTPAKVKSGGQLSESNTLYVVAGIVGIGLVGTGFYLKSRNKKNNTDK